MSTTTIVKKVFSATDGKSIIVSYDTADNSKVELKLMINADEFNFSAVSDIEDFMVNMVQAINLVHSVSGSGTGYVSADAGTTSSSDPIID